STFILRRRSLMCGTAAAASSRSTVMRTSSEPGRASAATCWGVASASAVSVLVIDWTTIGAPPPTFTWPTFTATDLRRGRGAAASSMTVSSAPHGGARHEIPRHGTRDHGTHRHGTRTHGIPRQGPRRQFGDGERARTVPDRHELTFPAIRAGSGDLDHRQMGGKTGAAGSRRERLAGGGGRGLANGPAAFADQERNQCIRMMVAPARHEGVAALDPMHEAVVAQEIQRPIDRDG